MPNPKVTKAVAAELDPRADAGVKSPGLTLEPPFSVQDAQTVITLARSAPLANLNAAEVAHGALNRIVAFLQYHLDKQRMEPTPAPLPGADLAE
jgi:hypothetical protein